SSRPRPRPATKQIACDPLVSGQRRFFFLGGLNATRTQAWRRVRSLSSSSRLAFGLKSPVDADPWRTMAHLLVDGVLVREVRNPPRGVPWAASTVSSTLSSMPNLHPRWTTSNFVCCGPPPRTAIQPPFPYPYPFPANELAGW